MEMLPSRNLTSPNHIAKYYTAKQYTNSICAVSSNTIMYTKLTSNRLLINTILNWLRPHACERKKNNKLFNFLSFVSCITRNNYTNVITRLEQHIDGLLRA